MLKVIGIGDNVCDKYIHIGKMFPGGQALNFAVYSKQLGCEAAYLGVLGDDAVALHIQNTLDLLGIDSSHTRHCSGENGYAAVDLINGDRIFITSNKGGVLRLNPIKLDEEDIAYISKFDIIHTSNNSYMDHELDKLRFENSILSYDFSTSWKDSERTEKNCRYIDFGFISCSGLSEEEIRQQLLRMHMWGCGAAVATRGSRGAIVYDGAGFYSVQPRLVEAVDTLGAGDSFTAGFLASYAGNIIKKHLDRNTPAYREALGQALKAAADLSAKTCLIIGAFGYGCDIK
ncbi:MAG: fructoselysine 6-kinase [Clostridiaceae bacterium]